jgi:segregation and condensation protein A
MEFINIYMEEMQKEENSQDNSEIIDQGEIQDKNNQINQSQLFDLITSDELSWQAIIYDLVKTEQLDPWNIDLGILADKYISIIQEIEEANFFISSKVLFACSLLLRLKSEILVNEHIQSLNELLYGKREEKTYEYERIEIDEDELPILVPKTPLPRSKKVTLNELMSALNQAIETENRRIKKEIKKTQAEKSSQIVLPKINRISLRDRIKVLYDSIKKHLNHPEKIKMSYSELAPTREEKISSFLPVLHLTHQERLYINQEAHFDEIWMMLDKIEEVEEESIEEEISE